MWLDVSEKPAVPEVMAPTTLHGVTTHQLATQIFTAVHTSNTEHEPTQNSLDNIHGKILYRQGCADFRKIYPKSHLKNSKRRKGDVKFHAMDPDIRRHRTEFRSTNDLAPNFCALLP